MGKISEAQKASFYDLPIDLCCVIHAKTRELLHANAAFENILGWKPSEMTGHRLDEFVASDTDKNNIEKAFSKLALGVHSFAYETEFRTKNHSTRNIDWKCYWDEKENTVFAIGRDITTHKTALNELSAQTHIDPLTGLHDRHAFLKLLETELANAIRHHYATAIILITLNQFEEYVLLHGLQKSEELIKRTALVLKTALRRKTDFLVRFDVAEFAVSLSHNDLEKATKVLDYLREQLAKQSINASFGMTAIADNQKENITTETFLAMAKKSVLSGN